VTSASINSQASSATRALPSSLTKHRAYLLSGVSRFALISRSSVVRLGLRPEPTTDGSHDHGNFSHEENHVGMR
jgi:hypothetical protein